MKCYCNKTIREDRYRTGWYLGFTNISVSAKTPQ